MNAEALERRIEGFFPIHGMASREDRDVNGRGTTTSKEGFFPLKKCRSDTAKFDERVCVLSSVRSTAPFPLYFQYSFLKHPSVTNFPSSLSLPLCTLLTLGGKPIISKRAALGFLLCQTQEKKPASPSTFLRHSCSWVEEGI